MFLNGRWLGSDQKVGAEWVRNIPDRKDYQSVEPITGRPYFQTFTFLKSFRPISHSV